MNQNQGEDIKTEMSAVAAVLEVSARKDMLELAQIQEEAMEFKAILTTKQEQLAELITVLEYDKDTVEAALNNLKSKHKNMKPAMNKRLTKLRNELMTMKERAAKFSSMCAVCESHINKLNLEMAATSKRYD
ncbi:protein bicaudal D-like [Nasonia vitripennis]|uniref:Uncharacterized protein n=1 Tax=Nasonia vitripennis TaxID=7425 RepID=A0A7M7QHQ6_NASVI|nr:protein bicaudal D-like [Nasonia vitripennis]